MEHTLDSKHVCTQSDGQWHVRYPASVQVYVDRMRQIPRPMDAARTSLDIHRFLVANGFTDRAIEAYRDYVQLVQRSTPLTSQPRALVQYMRDFHNEHVGQDVQGRPILVSRPGQIQAHLLKARYPDAHLLSMHVQYQEQIRAWCTSTTRPVYSTRIVLDLRGLNATHVQMLPQFRRVYELDERLYPETIHDVTIVCLSPLLAHVYKLCQRFMDATTLSKLEFVPGDRATCIRRLQRKLPTVPWKTVL